MNILVQEGTFYRLTLETHKEEISEPGATLVFGGRFNSPGLFRTLYLGASEQGCFDEMRVRVGGDLRRVKPLVLGVFHVRLGKILDLTDSDIVKVVLKGQVADQKALTVPGDYKITHRLGAVAYKRGFEGILFYSPVNLKNKNLAVFLDRLSPNSFVKKLSTRKVNIGCQPLAASDASFGRAPEQVWQKVYQVI
jgi:RES domain-containing protein